MLFKPQMVSCHRQFHPLQLKPEHYVGAYLDWHVWAVEHLAVEVPGDLTGLLGLTHVP